MKTEPAPTAAQLATGTTGRRTGRPRIYADSATCRHRAYRLRKRRGADTATHPIDAFPEPVAPGVGICGPRVVVSLCDWSGEWSRPYRERGYTVVQVDLRRGTDVRLMEFPDLEIHGILAAPPCTRFSLAGNGKRRSRAELAEALGIVDACLRLVALCRPAWWAVENPPGKLRRWLGAPAHMFQPWWYGDHHRKRTALWGQFQHPARSVFEEPAGLLSLVGQATTTSKQRSTTPEGFARAFADANP